MNILILELRHKSLFLRRTSLLLLDVKGSNWSKLLKITDERKMLRLTLGLSIKLVKRMLLFLDVVCKRTNNVKSKWNEWNLIISKLGMVLQHIKGRLTYLGTKIKILGTKIKIKIWGTKIQILMLHSLHYLSSNEIFNNNLKGWTLLGKKLLNYSELK